MELRVYHREWSGRLVWSDRDHWSWAVADYSLLTLLVFVYFFFAPFWILGFNLVIRRVFEGAEYG